MRTEDSCEKVHIKRALNDDQLISFYLIIKGKTGDWMNHFSPELNKRIDEWIEKNLEGTDLKSVTELDRQD